MHDYIVCSASASTLMDVSIGLINAGHFRHGSHVMTLAVRIALDTSLAAVCGEHSVLPFESLLSHADRYRLVSKRQCEILLRIHNSRLAVMFRGTTFVTHQERFLADVKATVAIVRRLQQRIDAAAKENRKSNWEPAEVTL